MAIEILMFNVSYDSNAIVGADCVFYPTLRIYWVKREVTTRLLEVANQVNISSLIPTKILKGVQGFRTSFVRTFHLPEDWDLWYRISRNGVKIYNITTPLFFYRQHSGSTTSIQSTSTHFLEERWRSLIGIDNKEVWNLKSSIVESHSHILGRDVTSGIPRTNELSIVLTDRFDQHLENSLLAIQTEHKINYVICLNAPQDSYSYFLTKFDGDISFVCLSTSFLNSYVAMNYVAGIVSKASIVHHLNDSKLRRVIEKSK